MPRLTPLLLTASWLAASLAGCGPAPPAPDTATLPPGVFGASDQDVPALQYARTAFTDASNTYANPVAGAEAVLAMEYVAGEFNTNPRWSSISDGAKQELLQGRADLRAAVGIAPQAPSQLVVDSLLQARNDLAAGNTAAAEKALDNPAFPAGGAKTVQILGNLPYVRMANLSTGDAASELNGTQDQGTSPPSFQPIPSTF